MKSTVNTCLYYGYFCDQLVKCWSLGVSFFQFVTCFWFSGGQQKEFLNSIASAFPLLLCFHFIKLTFLRLVLIKAEKSCVSNPSTDFNAVFAWLLCPLYGFMKYVHLITSKYSVWCLAGVRYFEVCVCVQHSSLWAYYHYSRYRCLWESFLIRRTLFWGWAGMGILDVAALLFWGMKRYELCEVTKLLLVDVCLTWILYVKK